MTAINFDCESKAIRSQVSHRFTSFVFTKNGTSEQRNSSVMEHPVDTIALTSSQIKRDMLRLWEASQNQALKVSRFEPSKIIPRFESLSGERFVCVTIFTTSIKSVESVSLRDRTGCTTTPTAVLHSSVQSLISLPKNINEKCMKMWPIQMSTFG